VQTDSHNRVICHELNHISRNRTIIAYAHTSIYKKRWNEST